MSCSALPACALVTAGPQLYMAMRQERINITNDGGGLPTWGRQKTIWSVCVNFQAGLLLWTGAVDELGDDVGSTTE